MMWVSALSQDVLVTSLMKSNMSNGWFVSLSVIGTLVTGLLLARLAVWLYRREQVLG